MPVKLCGILNLTPDSFSDGGRYRSTDQAYKAALQMIEDGAEIIDIGGDSTRPSSVCIDLEEEWARISKVIKLVAKETCVSVDTHRAEIARRALEEGAKIINDISAGFDPEMFNTLADTDASLVIMFSSCKAPHTYSDQLFNGIEGIVEFLESKIAKAIEAGINKQRIIIDPGMGRFISNNASDSFNVLNNLRSIEVLGQQIMLGVSRKGFLPDRSDSTSAMVAYSAIESLSPETTVILRVHNVKAHVEYANS